MNHAKWAYAIGKMWWAFSNHDCYLQFVKKKLMANKAISEKYKMNYD